MSRNMQILSFTIILLNQLISPIRAEVKAPSLKETLE
jgi:hypothetical protein